MMTATALRTELELPLPGELARLPVDHRGYPVPWFVAWVDGRPEFRAMDREKWWRAVNPKNPRCWVCGGSFKSRLGFLETFAFLIGPMCATNRVSSEPPSHRACAEWSARNCPFMARPHARRREDELVSAESCKAFIAGEIITRNPGVGLVWPCTRYGIFNDGNGQPLVEVGPLTAAPSWWREGRPAARADVLESIGTGLPLLEATLVAEVDPVAARAELRRRLDAALRLLPAA